MRIQSDLTNLIFRAQLVRSGLDQLAERFPDSDASKRPFSQLWWSVQGIKLPPLVIEWSYMARTHFGECIAFASRNSIPYADVLGTELLEWLLIG